jgi:hypothetical protein
MHEMHYAHLKIEKKVKTFIMNLKKKTDDYKQQAYYEMIVLVFFALWFCQCTHPAVKIL